jgi:hypothetical protein
MRDESPNPEYVHSYYHSLEDPTSHGNKIAYLVPEFGRFRSERNNRNLLLSFVLYIICSPLCVSGLRSS